MWVMKCEADERVKCNPYLTFLAGLPEEGDEDPEDILSLLGGLRSWLGWAGSLIGPGSTVMTRAAKKREKKNK